MKERINKIGSLEEIFPMDGSNNVLLLDFLSQPEPANCALWLLVLVKYDM